MSDENKLNDIVADWENLVEKLTETRACRMTGGHGLAIAAATLLLVREVRELDDSLVEVGNSIDYAANLLAMPSGPAKR